MWHLVKCVDIGVAKGAANKAGYTLVEVLTVVAIVGILSAAGFAGLQNAVANNRIKDAAINVSAFMERVANDTRRMGDSVCVKKAANKDVLFAYKAVCSSSDLGAPFDSFELDSPVKFISNENDGIGASQNWHDNGAQFTPKFGLSPAPAQGFWMMQYGGKALFGAAVKSLSKNNMCPKIKYSDDDKWGEL